jgi:hypothetical protein
VHHASLKEIFQKLIVDHSPTCLDLQHKPVSSMVGVGVEGLLRRTASPEKDRNANLFVSMLAGFNLEANFHQMFAEGFENLVAIVFIRARGDCFRLVLEKLERRTRSMVSPFLNEGRIASRLRGLVSAMQSERFCLQSFLLPNIAHHSPALCPTLLFLDNVAHI